MTQRIAQFSNNNIDIVFSSKTDQSIRRDELLEKLNLHHVREVLSNKILLEQITENDGCIICTIIHRNILSGRVARLKHRRDIQDTQVWLANYVITVANHYTQEKERWRLFKTPAGHTELYEMLCCFSRGYVKQLRLWTYGIQVEDIAHDAFCDSSDWLRTYPFDLDLRTWLDRHVRECALRVNQIAPETATVLPLDDADDARYYDDIYKNYRSQQIIHDNWNGLQNRLSELSDKNFEVFRLWYHGFGIVETAQKLDLTPQAVANRRHRLQKTFQTECLCNNKHKRENRSNTSNRSLA